MTGRWWSLIGVVGAAAGLYVAGARDVKPYAAAMGTAVATALLVPAGIFFYTYIFRARTLLWNERRGTVERAELFMDEIEHLRALKESPDDAAELRDAVLSFHENVFFWLKRVYNVQEWTHDDRRAFYSRREDDDFLTPDNIDDFLDEQEARLQDILRGQLKE